jgi:steroid delta-isomerase-like uncharacterized protein
MRARPPAANLQSMNHIERLTLELDLGADPISGNVLASGRTPQRFAGYVSLIAALEELRPTKSTRRKSMPASADSGLRERREAVVREHVEAENRHDVEAVIATFDRARYEVIPLGEPSDGEAAVKRLLDELIDGFPDFRAELQRLHHADDAVILEAQMTGTHGGPWGGIPATGRRIDLPIACIFDFEEQRLVCEKVYLDFATLLRQLGQLPETPSVISQTEDSRVTVVHDHPAQHGA